METDPAVAERVAEHAEAAAATARDFDAPTDPPDRERAATIVSEGLGPTVSLFCEIRTGGRSVYLSPTQYDRLEGAMNWWLECYAACFGVDLDGEYQLREAAQLLVDTHDARAVAEVLTGVPADRTADEPDRQ